MGKKWGGGEEEGLEEWRGMRGEEEGRDVSGVGATTIERRPETHKHTHNTHQMQ